MEIKSFNRDQITQAIDSVQNMLVDHEALYISSSDQFLSEYVPLEDCLRYYLTGFSGSTAELLLTNNEVLLFVDGRYHEQADLERHPKVTNIKYSLGADKKKMMIEELQQRAITQVWIVAERTSLEMYQSFKRVFSLELFDQMKLYQAIHYKFNVEYRTPYLLNQQECGTSSLEKLEIIFADQQDVAYFICAADQVSWITNLRGFHAPFQSFIMAKALITAEHIYLFNDGGFSLDDICLQNGLVSLHNFNELEQIVQQLKVSRMFVEHDSITVSDATALKSVALEQGSITKFQKFKNSVELSVMRSAFMRSNHAIINALRWIKQSSNISELDIYNKVNECYQQQGAVEQSFKTIAAVDENASIIHFGASAADKKVKEDSIVLIDSGAHYHEGYATDTTRTICAGDNPHPDFIKYYTLVLKGLLQAEMAVFPVGTKGMQIDAFARHALWQTGLDYMHGTGHGVGINVHEAGFSISTKSITPLYASLVGSIEPGYYKSGVGGIRLENIVEVVEHDTFTGMLCFKPLTIIGYDFNLIDLSLLTAEEKLYLKQYEKLCQQQGTTFNYADGIL